MGKLGDKVIFHNEEYVIHRINYVLKNLQVIVTYDIKSDKVIFFNISESRLTICNED